MGKAASSKQPGQASKTAKAGCGIRGLATGKRIWIWIWTWIWIWIGMDMDMDMDMY